MVAKAVAKEMHEEPHQRAGNNDCCKHGYQHTDDECDSKTLHDGSAEVRAEVKEDQGDKYGREV